jgi:glutamate racemase
MSKVNQLQNQPIGVFDSGLGGLTVVKELMKVLPNEDIVYFGDTARVPYGTKSPESIVRFSAENTKILLKHHVKMVVIACNSSASYAIPHLKQEFDLPIAGVINPGARKAVKATKNARIGVIATAATINSRSYERSIQQINPNIEIFTRACPMFVPLVEEGWLTDKITEDVARRYLTPLKKSGVDTLILGCTHYPLLKKIIAKVMGKNVQLIDSAQEVAREVKGILEEHKLFRPSVHKAEYKFLVSDRPQEFHRVASHFLGFNIEKIAKTKDDMLVGLTLPEVAVAV